MSHILKNNTVSKDKIEVIIAPLSFFSEILPPPLCTVRVFNTIVSRHAFQTPKNGKLEDGQRSPSGRSTPNSGTNV